LQWLVGEPVTSVNGRIATIAHNGIEVEDTGTAQLQFANGALGTVMCATSMWPGHFRTTTIAGTDGTAVLADGQLLFWQFMHETATDNDIRQRLLRLPGTGIGGSDPSAGVDSDGHAAVLQDFMGAIVEKQPLAVGGYEARKSVAIIRAVYESALADGAPVGVDSKGVPSPS